MPGPPPAVAAARLAVRRWLEDAGPAPDSLVLVACSGGADSLALTAATGFAALRAGLRVGVVIVDHGLQGGSATIAARAAEQCRALLPPGSPVEVGRVHVPAGPAGPEGQARAERYAVLFAAAQRLGASAVLTGHTRDDQAEQVLLGLARGSGARSLAGMPAARSFGGTEILLGRPFLGGRRSRRAGPDGGITRDQTERVCTELGLDPWSDPHNEVDDYARVRARRALRLLEDELGPGLATNLARSADLLRDDADALDAAAEEAYRSLGAPPWPVAGLAAVEPAVRTRLYRRCAREAGSSGTDLTSEHLLAVDALVTDWHGQGPLHLPGGVRAGRGKDGVWLRGRT